MAELSSRSKKLLRRAGWIEGRSQEVAGFLRLLESEGYPVFPAVIEFLRKFGGLRIENPSAKRPAAEKWHFDVAEASSHIYLERIQALYVPRVHSNLCIIGEADNDITLLMDEKGRVYGGFEESLVFLGESGEEAIDELGSDNYARPVDGKA